MEQQYQEYYEQVKDLLEHGAVQKMARFTHHHHVTCLEHCLHVSYFSYCLAKRMGYDARAAARGGLLHDLFLYDWHEHHEGKFGSHIFRHPVVACQTASRYFDLSDKERDIILNHMWPLAPHMPHCAESRIVMLMDKYCAMLEFTCLDKRHIGRLRLVCT